MRRDPYGNELLSCMYFKHGAYYYVKRNKWRRIGHTYNAAMREWLSMQETAGTMPQLINKTFEHYEARNKSGELSDASLKGYSVFKSTLNKAFANMDPHEVTPATVKQFLAHYYGTKPGAANRALVVLRGVFDLGMDTGVCEFNPAKQIKGRTIKARSRYLTDAEFRSIRQCAKGQLPLIMDVLYYTGQRIGDVLAIKQADIHDGCIHFVQQKTNHPINIEIGPELEKAIKAARKGPVTALWLFSKNGKAIPYQTVRSAWDAACKLAKVEGANLHDIRAKAATDYRKLGGDSQTFTGHEDAKTHEGYIRQKDVPVAQSLDSLKVAK